MTREEVQLILQKYVNVWDSANTGCHLWVALAYPGAAITIPNTTFGLNKDPQQVAGMNVRVHVQLIVLREDMTPESLLTTFFHEYGHACYGGEHPGIPVPSMKLIPRYQRSAVLWNCVWRRELKSLPTARRSQSRK
jgi:hypothetical protein